MGIESQARQPAMIATHTMAAAPMANPVSATTAEHSIVTARRQARLDAQQGSQIDPASHACRRRPARSIALLGWALGSAAASSACQSQPLGSLLRCALRDHPEPERRKHLRVDQRMLPGLQIVPCQHPGEIGTAGLK
jgi:hypothetical protein